MTTPTPDETTALLEGLSVGGPASTRAIAAIAEIAASLGLSRDDFSTLIHHTFDGALSTTQRLGIIRRCLVPKPDFLLDPALINRVISALGTPEIYYKNGKQHKLKRMSIGCQQALLEWLICALPLFGHCVFRYLRRSLPLLVTLLLYEFLRPHVAVLIVLAAHGTNAFVANTRSPLRYWHVKYVADLAERFPFDASLHTLLAFFRMSNRDLDYSAVFAKGAPPKLNHTFEMVSYPSEEIRRLLAAIVRPPDDLVTLQVKQVEQHLSRVFSHFRQQAVKRKRTSPDNLVFDALEALNAVSIGSIDSVTSLAAHFEDISITNVSSVLSVTSLPNERFRAMFVALLLLRLDLADAIVKKLLYAIKYHVLTLAPHNSALAFSQLLRFGLYGGLRSLQPPLVEYLTLSSHESPKELMHLVTRQTKLLEFITDVTMLRPCFASVLANLERAFPVQADAMFSTPGESNTLAMRFFFALGRSIRRWNFLYAQQAFPEFLATISHILTSVFAFAQAKWIQFDLSALFGLLEVFRALKTVDTTISGDYSALVPPPVLTYQLIVSTNPVVMSEMLGYIAFLKTVDLSHSPDSTLQLRNSYVVDAINFVWKDAALKNEPGTLNWGMLLDRRYVEKVAAHNYFSYSNLIRLRTVGGLSQNPSLAYMCAELMWQLEDQQPGISTRHPGPLAEEMVKQLHQDPEITWLTMSYDEIRVSLLNSLDRRGFSGLCDLLFSSLKLLADKRAN